MNFSTIYRMFLACLSSVWYLVRDPLRPRPAGSVLREALGRAPSPVTAAFLTPVSNSSPIGDTEIESQSSSSSKPPRWDLLILLFAIGKGPGEALLFLL